MVHVSRHVNIGFKSDNSLYGRETPRGSVADVRLSDPGSHGLWYAHAIAVTMPPCRLQEGVAGVAVAGCMGGPSPAVPALDYTAQPQPGRGPLMDPVMSASSARCASGVSCVPMGSRRATYTPHGWVAASSRERASIRFMLRPCRETMMWCSSFWRREQIQRQKPPGVARHWIVHWQGAVPARWRWNLLPAVAQKVIAPLPFTVEIFPFRIKTLSQFWVSLWQPRSPFFLSYLNKSTRFCPNFCITCRLHELTEQVLPFHLPMSLRFSTSEQVSPFLSTKRQGCGWLGSFFACFCPSVCLWKYGAIDPSSDTSICEFPFWARMLGSVQIPSHRLLHGFVQPSSFRASPQQIAWKQVSLTVGEGGKPNQLDLWWFRLYRTNFWSNWDVLFSKNVFDWKNTVFETYINDAYLWLPR